MRSPINGIALVANIVIISLVIITTCECDLMPKQL